MFSLFTSKSREICCVSSYDLEIFSFSSVISLLFLKTIRMFRRCIYPVGIFLTLFRHSIRLRRQYADIVFCFVFGCNCNDILQSYTEANRAHFVHTFNDSTESTATHKIATKKLFRTMNFKHKILHSLQTKKLRRPFFLVGLSHPHTHCLPLFHAFQWPKPEQWGSMSSRGLPDTRTPHAYHSHQIKT